MFVIQKIFKYKVFSIDTQESDTAISKVDVEHNTDFGGSDSLKKNKLNLFK